MIKKVSFIIFLFSFIFIVGYITSSGLLSVKKNMHSPTISENRSDSFIASGHIVSLLFNEDSSQWPLRTNKSQGYTPAAKSPPVPDTLFARGSNTNFTDRIISHSDATDENLTLDSNVIDLLTKIIMSSIYHSNKTSDSESPTKQFALTAKTEPQILSGNWTFRVVKGLIKDFKAKFTMFSINGTERHIYELYNFLPKLNNFNHISSSQGNIISGTIDVKLNGEEIWKGINCTLTISKDSIIMILLNSRSTENEFNNQPIYGIMESFKKIRGNQTTVKSLAGEKSTGSLIENRLNSRNDTTQIISGIIDSANKQASHYATTRNKTGEKDLGQFNNANNLSIDILRDSPIAERHTNIIIVKGADNPSNEEFFYPQNIFVSPGSTITWVNKDSAIHTATATNEEGLIIGYSLFDTGFIQTGESSKPIKMPQQGGVFSYYCKIHPFMTGTLTVASPSNGMAYAK